VTETLAKRTLIAGVGSPHGDDEIGWLVVDELRRLEPSWNIVRLATPAELLDRLEGVERLIVCDACQGSGPVGSFHTWRWPSAELMLLRFAGTHDLGLVAALEWARVLGRLPPEVLVWGVETGPTTPEKQTPSNLKGLAIVVSQAVRDSLLG